MMEKTGTITLSTPAAATLFEHEVKGQMSDGNWENALPSDHWQFWCALTTEVGTVDEVKEAVPLYRCKKAGYNLTSRELLEVIGPRMVRMGRMATALGRLLTHEEASAAEYMPETLADWLQMKATGKWEYNFVAKYMAAVTSDHALAYYTQAYTERDMRRDLGRIKAAIRGVKARHPRWAGR